MENWTERVLGELQGRFPGWDIWVVYRAVGGAIWCALRHGAHTREVINTDRPGDLVQEIEERENP